MFRLAKMVTQELLDYIRSQIEENEASIIDKLLNSGWSKEDILQAFSLVKSSHSMSKNSPMENSDYWTHVLTVIIAFITTLLPGIMKDGITTNATIYIYGAFAVIAIATSVRIVANFTSK